MRVVLARAMMVLAALALGDHRREWAQAMVAEFEVAVEAGAPLGFASGILLTAWRALPSHEEGRYALASYLLALGVIVPVAGLFLTSVAGGSPFLAPDQAGVGGLFGYGRPVAALSAANRAGVPVLMALTGLLGLGQLGLAVAVLDRAWARVAAIGRIGAAVLVTTVSFAAILFLADPCALPQAVVLAGEFCAVWTLARWHAALTIAGTWSDTAGHDPCREHQR